MPIISQIGRRSVSVRLLAWSICGLLILGSFTMLYPFILMLSGSTKSAVDTPSMNVIPPFLREDEALYQKHIEGLFNESFDMMKTTYYSDAAAFNKVILPETVNTRLVKEWLTFLDGHDLPHYTYTVGYVRALFSRGVMPHTLRKFKKQFIERYEGDIDQLNREMGMEFVNWSAFFVMPVSYPARFNKLASSPVDLEFREFKAREPVDNRYYFSAEGFYKTFLKTQYTKKIENYNKEHGSHYTSWEKIHLDRQWLQGNERTDKEQEDWESFVRTILNLLWVRVDEEAGPAYRLFLQAKYGSLEGLNRNYGTDYESFGQIRLIQEPPEKGLAFSDWAAFIQGWKDPDTSELHIAPLEMLRVYSVDFLFRDYLKATYGSIDQANEKLGIACKNWLEVLPPQQGMHYMAFREKTGWLRWEFTRRNFISVVDYIVLHGRGLWNTVIYCALAVLAALIVNPLAAYALSRYKPPSTYKVLLFLMLTMAFPPMVTQIPAFLMLREFHLLNTFWALVLPGLANGYWIFLLKGFFDSLPGELYDSAAIDGAGELRIFWQITMSLSKPVLAVIALNAFTMAYSNFMMALLICQDDKMWTLMPWLYQLQQRSGQGVVFASLIIAAVPTFLVFVLCQNVIMRGIVVPVEK